MRYEIFVEGIKLNLPASQVIATTLQASAIGSGDLYNRLTDFTNGISVAKTSNNVRALGRSNMVNVNSSFPYLKKSARVLIDGLQIMSGVVIIKDVDSHFNLEFYSELKDLSTSIGDKVLSALDFGDSPITWNNTFIDSKRKSLTGGWTCPVINYGQIDPTLSDGTIGDFYLPAVLYKDIITAIFANAGFTISGDFHDNDDYFNRMALAYSRKEWVGTTSFKLNEVLSDDMLQADFVKDLFMKFGLFPKFSGMDCELIVLNDILAIPNYQDWTLKRANKKESIVFAWPNWAQKNWFRYPKIKYQFPEDSIRDNVFDDSVDFNNLNIDMMRDVYTSIFQPANQMPDFSYDIIPYKIASSNVLIQGATMPVWETVPINYTFDNEPQPMLVLLRDRDAGEGATIVYNGNARADYKVGFFVNQSLTVGMTNHNGLTWNTVDTGANGLIDLYYPRLQSLLGAFPKTVTRFYNLTLDDILHVDLLTPVRDNNDNFLISKIKNFIPGKITEVELIRITNYIAP